MNNPNRKRKHMEFVFLGLGVLGGIKPMVSFCQAVPWWKWCRDPKIQNPLRPIKKIVKRL